MFRAFSTRRYERLGDGGGGGGGGGSEHHQQPSSLGGDMLDVKLRRVTSLPVKLRRVTSLPVKFINSTSRKLGQDSNVKNAPAKPTAAGKLHPILSLLDPRRRKKATAKPEFARYLQYIKEGGVWDAKSDKPSIYYT